MASRLEDVIQRGLAAARPLATAVVAGTLYYSTDTEALERSNGTTWESYSLSVTSNVTGPGASTDNAIVRWNGTGGIVVQDSLITIGDTGIIAFPDGVKQTFNPDGTNAGINVGSQAGDPSSPADGDIWYNSTSNNLRVRINGVTYSLGGGYTFSGSKVLKAADQIGANYSAGAVIAWDSEEYDTGGYHDNAVNNDRFTIPSGVSKVNVGAWVRLEALTSSLFTFLYIRLNGTVVIAQGTEVGTTAKDIAVTLLGISVIAGDYFDAYLLQETDTSINVIAARSGFSIQRVDG